MKYTVSTECIIREMDADELQDLYNEMLCEYHLIGELKWLYRECFYSQLELIKSQPHQLTGKKL